MVQPCTSSFLTVICLLVSLLVVQVSPVAVHSLHWNSTNPIFRIDNTDHIVDVNSGNLPFEYDQLNIICPVAGHGRGTRGREEGERYIIYNVSKEEYDSCRISQTDPRVVAVCDKPDRQLQFTITFRSFSPTPRGLEFRPGQDYYFISTSSRRDLHRRVGGSCSTHNMKVIFKVAKSKAEEERRDAVNNNRQPAINRPRNRVPIEEGEEGMENVRPIETVGSFRTGLDQSVKRIGVDKSVVKQEASTMSGSKHLSPLFSITLFLAFWQVLL